MTAQKAHHTPPPESQTKPEAHQVLIVDDEPAICFAYRKLFESEQFAFDICDSVEAAIPLIQQGRYFAVISDVRFAGLGNEDGVYLASVIRREQPESKVILVTGYGNDNLKKTAHELGVSHYFEKPVKPSLILSLLRSLHAIAHEQEGDPLFQEVALN